jgi:solute:Na+ symporter, SSS family
MLTTYDYIVIGFYFAFMAGIGWAFKRFISNSSDYFRSGGEMLWWICGAGVFMTQFSAWTFTGAASKAHTDGWLIFFLFLANAVGFVFNAICFGPWFRQMRAVTAMQTVRERFGRFAEQFYLWISLPMGVIGSSIGLYGLGVFVAAVFNFPLDTTILAVGIVVVVMSVTGGSWAVIASDFLQTLILMPVTVVAAVLTLMHFGGVGAFNARLPEHFSDISERVTPSIAYIWIGSMMVKQFITNNNMLDAYRYLSVKDGRHARKGAILAAALMLVGPLVWFVPPMGASILMPNLAETFPALGSKAGEGAYIAMCSVVFPVGMMGVLVSAIFAATMSSMDTGLNKNAGFFVKNFYQVALRPRAGERELVLAGKVASVAFGLLVVSTAIYWSRLQDLPLFDLMMKFSTSYGVPLSIPLVWGMLVRRAPQWAVYVSALVTLSISIPMDQWWAKQIVTWWYGPLNAGDVSDAAVALALIVNVIVASTVFLGSVAFAGHRSPAEVARVEHFFTKMRTPIDFAKEEGKGSDAMQLRTLGLLCSVYGGFLLLLVLIPNDLKGRLAFVFCGGCMFGVGWALRVAGKRRERQSAAAFEVVMTKPAPVAAPAVAAATVER